MALLTDRTLATGVTLNDYIHIVITGDTSQNSAGSSYKATIKQVSDAILSGVTGNTQLYEVGIGIDSTQRVGVGADASGGYSFVGGGTGNTASNCYSVVSGGFQNEASGVRSFIGGGGLNNVISNNSSIVGGLNNETNDLGNFIGGGTNNTTSCYYSSIVGGCCNTILTQNSFIGGGTGNTINGINSFIGGGTRNTINKCFSLVGGGFSNLSNGFHSLTLGGCCNRLTTNCSVIVGGECNRTTTPGTHHAGLGGCNNLIAGQYSSVVGGRSNTTLDACSFIGGGTFNRTLNTSEASFIGGGMCNTISGHTSTIVGGSCNTTIYDNSFIGGGFKNTTFAEYSTILGGSGNTVTHLYSSAVGRNITSVSACTFHVNYLALQNTPETDVQTVTQYLTRDSATGVVKTKIIPGPTVFGLYVQTGNSITVSGTTSELSIVGSGIGTLSVPPNGFSVGDSFAVRVSGDLGANNGNTLTLRVKSGSVEFGVVGPITMPNVTSSHFSFEITFTIRALGTTGNAKIQSSGFFTFTQNAGGSFEGGNFSTLNQTTFDTTISNQLDITAQFNSTNSANFIFTEILVLNKIY